MSTNSLPLPPSGAIPSSGGMAAQPLGEIATSARALVFMGMEMVNRVPARNHVLELTLSSLLTLALTHRSVELYGKDAVQQPEVMAGLAVMANRLTAKALADMADTLRMFDDGAGSGDSFLEAMRGMTPPSQPPAPKAH